MAGDVGIAASPPLVSVIVPVFNGARTLPWTLRSLAAQDWSPVEWLVIDDGSTDGSVAVIDAFLEEHPGRGRRLSHAENRGLSRTLNEGLREAGGDLVLVVHQDLELVGRDWVRRAVGRLAADGRVAVVTSYYGRSASDDLTFVKRAFGVISRQFHFPGEPTTEMATFTEFKADLFRRAPIEEREGFPERFRIAGEDLWVSYRLRQDGYRIEKDFGLEAIQRFSGRAETLPGNLAKTFGFGQAMGLVLVGFGLFPTRGTRDAPYSRSRSWFRASQPVAVLGALVLLIALVLTRNEWVGIALAAWVLGRYIYHVTRVTGDLERLGGSRTRALGESLATGFIGLATDVVYSMGLLVGMLRSRSRTPV